MKKFILLFLVILNTVTVLAQKQNITFSHLTTDDGLSQFSVNSLYVDEEGGIWIGTREGLNRYNGNNIKTFKLQKNNPNSLFCNTILRITGDQKGKVYVLCTEGVAEFDLTTQKFTTLLQGKVTSIYFNERLFIGKKDEVYVFNKETRNFDLTYHLAGKDISIVCLHLDDKGNLWMGTENSGVYKLDKDKTLTHPIEKGNITSIYQDSSKELWIGSWEYGLYHIDREGIIHNMRHDPSNPNSVSSDFVRDCCEDNNGNIWIGTFNGLNRYQKSNGRFDVYTAGHETESLTHSSIWCIVKDAQGTLWLGTYFGGVNYFNPEYEIYTRYKASDTERNGLSSSIIGRMIEDKDGNLWICTEGGGVNVYYRKEGIFRWLRHEEGRNSISHNNVKAIYYDQKRERMWFGTHLGGLNKLDLRTNRFTHYRMKEDDPHSLPSDIIRDITPFHDQLIVGTQNGVCLFDPETETCQQLFKDTREGQAIKMVADLFVDRDSTLWIAATGEGVYSYRFDTDKLINYRHDSTIPNDVDNHTNSISNNNVNSIMQDSQGNLWFSTSGSGLDLYHKETNCFENFDMQKNGLSSDCIYEIHESSFEKNCLLLITNQGFSQFDVPNRKFHNYSIENGFPLTAVNENALYITRDGEVFLGGVQGMISFHEKALFFTPKSYNILLSRLIVNGKEITPDDETGILQYSLSYTPEITLQANQNMFSIEYTTSNYIPANRDKILYRLEGFSNEWNSVQRGQNFITYTNLNPGTYTFIVKTQREDIKAIRLKIHILPPWYKTWWAYLIYVVLTGSLLLYLIRVYKSRIRLRESLKYEQKHIEDLESLNQSKLRFFTNISHEFRTPLTLIVGQIETLLQVQTFTPTVYNKILRIYKSSLQLRELIGELLDFRKQEQGHMKIKVSRHNLVTFLYENYLLFLEYASSKKINFKFKKEEEDIEVWYDQKQMQKVINNLLSNALKHTKEEDTISICVKKQNGNAIIVIQDTGSGIDATEIDKIFDRFYQTEQLDTLAVGAGTGIGLALTKGIIELHHGTISVESEKGKGSSFIITLKLGNGHFEQEQISLKEEIIQQQEPAQPGTAAIMAEAALDNDIVPAHPSDTKMLIVEDDASIREMLAELFRTFYQVITASDGVEALELVQKEMPSIVLSDVVMPRMSGTELCKQIKGEFNTCHIPVVLLTARTAVEHTVEGLRLGADDYITKPFSATYLKTRIASLLRQRKSLQEIYMAKLTEGKEIAVAEALTPSQPQITPYDEQFMQKVMEFIEEQMDNAELTIDEFAEHLMLSRTIFYRKLKSIIGLTPVDFIREVRIKRAAQLIDSGEYNFSQVAYMTGFNDPKYFSKCFKKVVGITPSEYKEKNK